MAKKKTKRIFRTSKGKVPRETKTKFLKKNEVPSQFPINENELGIGAMTLVL